MLEKNGFRLSKNGLIVRPSRYCSIIINSNFLSKKKCHNSIKNVTTVMKKKCSVSEIQNCEKIKRLIFFIN